MLNPTLKTQNSKQLFVSGLLLVALVVVGIWYSPGYLAYSDKPEKSDAVVLFLGSDYKDRQKEANLIISEGYARYLIIPAYGQILDSTGTSPPAKPGTPGQKPFIADIKSYFENTHIEILEAKSMMAQYGLKSAIFVSSPFHMRRIKLIAEKVFGTEPSIFFVPTPFETVSNKLLHLTMADWKNLALEYIKIVWFMIYSIFT